MAVLNIDLHEHIGIFTLNRPDALNALNYELYKALEDAVRDTAARIIVITGAGDKSILHG
ncbi:MAG: enoyl-CoA hydratase/isomerase family protein [Pseudomonadota bacterium]